MSGKNPVWNTKNEFALKLNGEPLIKFGVFDKDTFSSDDPIGDGAIAVS